MKLWLIANTVKLSGKTIENKNKGKAETKKVL